MMAVLTPITSPREFTNGPPELPGFRAASVWSAPLIANPFGAVMSPQTLVISIMAGISTSFIEKHLGAGHAWRVVRTMPNTPMLVGEGMVAIAPGAHATPEDLAEARKLFQVAATVIDVRGRRTFFTLSST